MSEEMNTYLFPDGKHIPITVEMLLRDPACSGFTLDQLENIAFAVNKDRNGDEFGDELAAFLDDPEELSQ